MTTITENRQPAPRSTLGRLVARHPVAAFLVMVYAITWAAFLPVILQGRGLLALPIDLTGEFAFNAVVSVATILGVALPAFLVTAATGRDTEPRWDTREGRRGESPTSRRVRERDRCG